MDFSHALQAAKDGLSIGRLAWGRLISVRVQYPTPDSLNTEPYLYMIKHVVGEKMTTTKRFPIDLSAESIFAEDWLITSSVLSAKVVSKPITAETFDNMVGETTECVEEATTGVNEVPENCIMVKKDEQSESICLACLVADLLSGVKVHPCVK